MEIRSRKDVAAALTVALFAVTMMGVASWRLYLHFFPGHPQTVFPDENDKCPQGYRHQSEGFGGKYARPICCPPGTACD